MFTHQKTNCFGVVRGDSEQVVSQAPTGALIYKRKYSLMKLIALEKIERLIELGEFPIGDCSEEGARDFVRRIEEIYKEAHQELGLPWPPPDEILKSKDKWY